MHIPSSKVLPIRLHVFPILPLWVMTNFQNPSYELKDKPIIPLLDIEDKIWTMFHTIHFNIQIST